jgi:hypothetical protein
MVMPPSLTTGGSEAVSQTEAELHARLSKLERRKQPAQLLVVTFATGKSMLPTPPPTSTLM